MNYEYCIKKQNLNSIVSIFLPPLLHLLLDGYCSVHWRPLEVGYLTLAHNSNFSSQLKQKNSQRDRISGNSIPYI